jgi:hypothetical protein
MANDDPTSLRMGFGYQQARRAGMTGFKSPPSVAEMNLHLSEAAATRKLQAIVQRHPSIKNFLRKVMDVQKAAGFGTAEQIYYALLYNRPDIAPAGYWDKMPKIFWPEKQKWREAAAARLRDVREKRRARQPQSN